MKENWISIGGIILLLGLLVLLAGLQYKWVGQISDSERVRLKQRLNDDTERFAADFNREIQRVFFTIQLNQDDIEKQNSADFSKRLDYLKAQAKYPGLAGDFYVFEHGTDSKLHRFNFISRNFEPSKWSSQLEEIKKEILEDEPITSILGKQLALIKPISKQTGEPETVVIREELVQSEKYDDEVRIEVRELFGYLVIMLDTEIVTRRILPDLVKKYFSGADGQNYKVSVVDSDGADVFHSHESELSAPDSSSKLFSVTPTDLEFFSEKTGNSILNSKFEKKRKVVFTTRSTKKDSSDNSKDIGQRSPGSVAKPEIDEEQTKPVDGQTNSESGVWTLKIQHTDGSLEKFVTNTRNRNLGISFGILTLLAASMLFIFVATQRARSLAQKQLDFVSSVSHEFRTPLSVIYSAGENLSDGVVNDGEKISNYGQMIKWEGKKLSGMVEQILEFAGARSGNRRYDFRETDVAEMLTRALVECEPQTSESAFEIVTEIAEGLPRISADERALCHAFQNLINNSLKYSNGNKWLKVTAFNEIDSVTVTVEDKGIGISQADMKNIFEPFYRAPDVVDRQISGNGLGLSLVKQIVEAHGGDIEVESRLGEGAKFTVRLPLGRTV